MWKFRKFPNEYLHSSKQIFNTGLKLEMLQEYINVPLDIFHGIMQNKTIETKLEAWLTFLSNDEPEVIIELITKYPEFKAMYETLYQMCRNVEEVMWRFSEELRIMDHNTVKYMIEEQQKEIETQRQMIKEKDQQLEEKDQRLEEKKQQLEEMNMQMQEMRKEIEELKRGDS